jgi:hypothetical protein
MYFQCQSRVAFAACRVDVPGAPVDCRCLQTFHLKAYMIHRGFMAIMQHAPYILKVAQVD